MRCGHGHPRSRPRFCLGANLSLTHHHTATLLGNGWSLSYDVSVEQGSSGIAVNDGTGRHDTYTLGTNGTYTCPEFFREGAISNNTFTLTFADTGRWVFNPFDGSATAGKLIQIITRNGDTMTLGYDTSGQLAQVVDDLGRTNTMSYNTSGQLASVTDFSGRSVTYQYYQGTKDPNGSAGDLNPSPRRRSPARQTAMISPTARPRLTPIPRVFRLIGKIICS